MLSISEIRRRLPWKRIGRGDEGRMENVLDTLSEEVIVHAKLGKGRDETNVLGGRIDGGEGSRRRAHDGFWTTIKYLKR